MFLNSKYAIFVFEQRNAFGYYVQPHFQHRISFPVPSECYALTRSVTFIQSSLYQKLSVLFLMPYRDNISVYQRIET